MLDVLKEIKEYEAIDLEQEIVSRNGELPEVIGSFTKVIDRLGKEQFKFTQQLEEIFLILENDAAQDRDCKKMEEEASQRKQEVEVLLQILLDLTDSLEDIYKYARCSGQSAWKEQMSLQWEKIGNQIEKYGIRRIEGAGTFFTPHLHVAKEVKEYPGVSYGQILDVLKTGYMYQGKILRKAEVIVNRWKE
jgi:molecular chaperone GrpE (heat shock protein)